jgi:hypothetical protein
MEDNKITPIPHRIFGKIFPYNLAQLDRALNDVRSWAQEIDSLVDNQDYGQALEEEVFVEHGAVAAARICDYMTSVEWYYVHLVKKLNLEWDYDDATLLEIYANRPNNLEVKALSCTRELMAASSGWAVMPSN